MCSISGADEEQVECACSLEDDAAEQSGAESLARLPLKAALGALLFASPRPLSLQVLAEAARADAADVEAALEELRQDFSAETHGITLSEVGQHYQLRTTPAAARVVQRLIPPRAKKLSRAAGETLAVIAYKQPVQRAEIEAIRGVDALPTLKTLLDAKLIRIVGRADSAGHPALYGTTQTFLEKFGLRDLSMLPSIRELEQLASEPGEAEEDDESGGLEDEATCQPEENCESSNS
ncbi:MAG TPA: SMC-Scp complex subunit ScpB [Oligoflexia bacterium]|nr:SMC-Scp complex subunit ScpB [Oligoflexia bacterium]